MEKLIELLNEYDGEDLEYGFIDGEIRRKVRNFDNERNTWKQVVWYTKHFGFIQWLVENDKINQQLLERYAMDYFNDESPVYGDNVRADRLIMILSVSNSPISDLIKLLDTEGGDDLKPSGKLVFNI